MMQVARPAEGSAYHQARVLRTYRVDQYGGARTLEHGHEVLDEEMPTQSEQQKAKDVDNRGAYRRFYRPEEGGQ